VRISAIVPTFNRPGQLGHCLAGLERQTLARDQFEVIVVDDGGPSPLGAELVQAHPRIDLKVIRQPRQGPATARNTGVAAARAPFVAFTDDDCLPAQDWLERMLAGLEATPDCLFGGRVVNTLGDDVYAVTSQLILELAYSYHNPDPAHARFFASNNMAMPTAEFRRVGGFDPGFRVAAEDREFCARWQRHGLRLEYLPEAVIEHAHHLTLGAFWRQHVGYGRGAWRYHALSRRQGEGHLVRDFSFHGRFMAKAMAPLSQRPLGSALRIGGLLAVWQAANTYGFFSEAARAVFRRGRPH
jgi:GT2 family glycosyltransferase